MSVGLPAAAKNEVFTALRPSLFAVAYHMLANAPDAEDMVQEAFLRWEQTDESHIRAPKAFLTTVVTRLCIRHLETARAAREQSAVAAKAFEQRAEESDPHTKLSDALAEALLVMLKALSPLERAVFLMREVFDCEYSDIAQTVDKSEENCRQILRRAREAVANRKPRYEIVPEQEEQIVKHFVQAAADGNWANLIEILADDATLVCDGANVGEGPESVKGVRGVAEMLVQRAARWIGAGASIEMVRFYGRPGAVMSRDGVPVSAMFLSTNDGGVRGVRVITCPVRLRSLLVINSR
jgi:RNA polymerase sigma-70 factor, ECF subfamily